MSLADHLDAIAAARALNVLAAEHEGHAELQQLLGGFGLTRARVFGVLMLELQAAESLLVGCPAAELATLARAHGCADADHLAAWLRGIRSDHEGEPTSPPECGAESLLVGAVLVYLLSRLRSEPPIAGDDAFAARGLDRARLVEGLRRQLAALCAAAPSLERAGLLLDKAAPPRRAAELYLVAATDEQDVGLGAWLLPGEPAANERPSVGVVVAKLRAARGLSRAELGRLAGLSLSTIRGIELGERDAKIRSARALAAAFDLSFVEFAAMIGSADS